MKRRLFTFLLAMVMLLTVSLSMSGCADKRTPIEVLSDAAAKTSEQAAQLFSSEILENAGKGGSVTIECKVPGQAEIGAAFYLNQDPSKMLLKMDVNLPALNDLDVTCHATQDSVVVSSDKIFGDANYGLNMKGLKDQFKASKLADPDSSIYIGDEGVAAIGEILDTLTSSSALDIDLQALLVKYRDFLVKQLEDSGKLEKTVQKGEIVVSAQLDHADISKMVEALATEIKADQQIKSLLLSLEDLPSTEKMTDEFYEMLDDAVKELKESEDKLSCGFTVTVNKKAGNIKTAEITFKENDEEVGKISFASESSKVTIDISSDENSIHYQMNLESNKLKSIEGRAVLHEGIVSEDEDASESRVEAEFKWEAADASNSSYSYTVKSYSGDNCVGTSTIKGTIKVDGKDSMVITVNLDFSSDESAISMPSIFSVKDITITIKAKDTAPQVPAYDNILEMSEDGIIELVTKVMSFAEVFS